MKKILVIEDDKLTRKTISYMLQKAMFEIFEAEDGEIGVSLALKHLPDLIVSDFFMPNLTGLEVFEKILEHKSISNIPFILLSGSKEYIKSGQELGIKYFLNKPFTYQELLGVLNKALDVEYNIVK